MADRFYCPDLPRAGRFALDGDEARHLARVRRLGVGCVVEVFDGRSFATRAEVTGVGRDHVDLTVLGDPLPEHAAHCRLTLATAVPKGERFDWLVEKATELGVERLIPLVTARSVVDPRDAKLDRQRRRVVEACKQCGRGRLMELGESVRFETLVNETKVPVRILAHPVGLPADLWPRISLAGEGVLAVGPEGGFTDAEVELARGSGWTLARLGPTILRVETAGLTGAAILLALCGDRVE